MMYSKCISCMIVHHPGHSLSTEDFVVLLGKSQDHGHIIYEKQPKKCTFRTFSYFHIMQLTVRCYILPSTLPVLWPVWQIAIILLHDVLPGKICVHIFRFQIVWKKNCNWKQMWRYKLFLDSIFQSDVNFEPGVDLTRVSSEQ